MLSLRPSQSPTAKQAPPLMDLILTTPSIKQLNKLLIVRSYNSLVWLTWWWWWWLWASPVLLKHVLRLLGYFKVLRDFKFHGLSASEYHRLIKYWHLLVMERVAGDQASLVSGR